MYSPYDHVTSGGTSAHVDQYAYDSNWETGTDASFHNVDGNTKRWMIQNLLAYHPEGVVVYDWDRPHAILVTDFTDGIFYVADPNPACPRGRIPESSACIAIANCESYYIVTNPGTITENVPVGAVDSCTAANGKITISGWAYDPTVPNQSITIHVYVGAPAIDGEGHNIGETNITNESVNSKYGISGKHGFNVTFSTDLRGQQSIYVYAIEASGKGPNPLIYEGSVNIPEIKTYNVSVGSVSNGTVSLSTNKAKEGDKVTVTATPASGYKLSSIKVNGTAISGNTFTMPAKDVTVQVTFVSSLAITSQPKSYTGTAGSTASFSVTATGTGLTYQWQVYSNGTWSDSNATGSKTNKISFNVTNNHNGNKYRCIVKDSSGQKVYSNTATVTVTTPLAVTKQPVNYTGAAGSTATFSVTATGTGLTYQWQVYSNGAWSNSNATGSKTNKISFKVTNNHNGNKYRCIIKDSNGKKIYSNTAKITVVNTVTITKQPANYTGPVGSMASFSVTAQGTGLTYQWQVYSNGAWKNSGATGANSSKIVFLTTKNHNGMKYRCVIRDQNGKVITSNAASVKVVAALSITKQPSNFNGTVGSYVTFIVSAQGEGLTYQWQVYSNGAWKNSGATGSNSNKIAFVATKNHNGMKYRCIVKDKYGKSVTSNAATMTVK
ncbi:MAG: immunoglobulin domain-containing protein [Clostridiales bacterium]|nr:immunoglobulin domain-containing protein [Clostridiales bacterium]